MFGFFNCTKSIVAGRDARVLFDSANLAFGEHDRIAVLGAPGSGKTILQALFAGRLIPDHGTVVSPPLMSWPIGNAGMFHPMLTGEQNVRTLAALLDVDPDRASAFVSLFSELGAEYHRPMRDYSGSMRTRFAFSMSMAVPFPFYVADDAIGTGDPSFRAKCERMMDRRLADTGLFFTTSNARLAERFATRFAVIHEQRIIECNTIAEARELLERARDDEGDFQTVLAGLMSA